MKAFTVWLWLVSLWEAWEASCKRDLKQNDRQVQLVEALCRRKYAGRPLAGLRAEYRIHVAGLLLMWRRVPKPVQLATLGTIVGMFATAAGMPDCGPLLGTVGGRRLRDEVPGLAKTLDAVDATALLDRLQTYRPTGRQGYPLNALWRAYLLSFVLDLPSTNALIRRLHDDQKLRLLCPGFPILGVFRLKGQPKRDGSIIVRSCKASQSPVNPIRDAILAVNHVSCPSLSSSGPRQWGESVLKTSRLPGALSLLARSWLHSPSAWGRR